MRNTFYILSAALYLMVPEMAEGKGTFEGHLAACEFDAAGAYCQKKIERYSQLSALSQTESPIEEKQRSHPTRLAKWGTRKAGVKILQEAYAKDAADLRQARDIAQEYLNLVEQHFGMLGLDDIHLEAFLPNARVREYRQARVFITQLAEKGETRHASRYRQTLDAWRQSYADEIPAVPSSPSDRLRCPQSSLHDDEITEGAVLDVKELRLQAIEAMRRVIMPPSLAEDVAHIQDSIRKLKKWQESSHT